MDDALRGFMEHWFAGLVAGLAGVGEDARHIILRACGQACAESYTAQVFEEAWQESRDLDRFLARLAERFPGGDLPGQRLADRRGGVQQLRVRPGEAGAGALPADLRLPGVQPAGEPAACPGGQDGHHRVEGVSRDAIAFLRTHEQLGLLDLEELQ